MDRFTALPVDVVLDAAALGLDPSQVPGLVGGQHQVRSVQEQLVVTISLPREPAPANLSFPSVSMTRNKSSHLFGLWFPSDIYIHGVPKKMSFLGKTAITTFKIIQNAKVWGVLENSGYLLPDEH